MEGDLDVLRAKVITDGNLHLCSDVCKHLLSKITHTHTQCPFTSFTKTGWLIKVQSALQEIHISSSSVRIA